MLDRTRNTGGGVLLALLEEDLLDIMEVHSGLSARLAETAGFKALWASGFAIATLMGVRDCSEASPAEVLTVIDWILQASGVPLLVDGDSGHGNFNTARRYARLLAQKGAAGVCFEDKLFPKRNSFFGDEHPLAPIEEFCGIVEATREACAPYPFAVVARTEALIAGRQIEEALARAHAYADAGAHAILVHSRAKTEEEVTAFARQWDKRAPLIIVPTTYPSLDRKAARANGISGLIWANQALRASVRAMNEAYARIKDAGTPNEQTLVSMAQIFGLLDYPELEKAERRFLPKQQ